MHIIDARKKMPVLGSNGIMDKAKINTVVIHHDGDYRPDRYNSLNRYIAEAKFHISKKWKRISYTYAIDNIGDIYQLNDENQVLYHCGNLTINRKSIAIKLDGNFEVQKPTAKQIRALKDLLVWLTTKRPDLPKIIRTSVRGHRQIKATACPGKNLYPLITKF